MANTPPRALVFGTPDWSMPSRKMACCAVAAGREDLGILVVAAADDLGLVLVDFGACVR